jgi:glutamine cyclotransferase
MLIAACNNPSEQESPGDQDDPETNKVYVTGKLWPLIYELKFKN